MRTKRQLLIILLKNVKNLQTGLCVLISTILATDKIDFDEFEILCNIITDNPTKRATIRGCSYYFPATKKFPRRIYLLKLIIKYWNI